MRIKILAVAIVGALASMFMPTAAFASDDARIHLIHGIPDTDVDVEIAGDVAIEGFEFGDTFDLAGFAGQTLEDLKVNLAGTNTVAIDAGDTALPASGNFTIIAHLDADGNPALAVFENDVSKIDVGEGRITVRHAAAAPAVDILAGGDPVFENVVNGEEGSADIAPGTLSVSVVPAGETTPVVIGPADFDVVEGESLIVYAVGSLDADTLTVLTEQITDIHSTPNAVHTGTSPVESSNSLVVLAISLAAISGVALSVTARRFLAVKA